MANSWPKLAISSESAPASGTMVPSASRPMTSLSTRCGSPLSSCIQGPSQKPRTYVERRQALNVSSHTERSAT